MTRTSDTTLVMDRKYKVWISAALGISIFSGIWLWSRPSAKNIIFIVDTSGSMTESKLISEVKESVKRVVLEETSPGDHIHLFTFDSEIRDHLKLQIGNPIDTSVFLKRLSQITALGQWTDLVSALDRSLQETVQLLQASPGRKTKIILYTDGKNDPPSGKRRSPVKSFNDLLG